MFVNMFQSTTIPVLEQVVGFAAARHMVLAGNLANMDTPGYHARDLSVEDFRSHLQAVIEANRQPAASSPGEMDHRAYERNQRPGFATILRHDDADVNVEREVTEMMKNRGQHNIALAIMVKQFSMLQSVISERV